MRGGELIELVGDVGSGKTTLVRGIVKGAGSLDQVASPSFTVSRQYSAGEFTIHHFDFYRLTEPGIMANELAEFLNDNKSVVIVEWPDIVNDILPATRLQIQIAPQNIEQRRLIFSYPEQLHYLIPSKT